MGHDCSRSILTTFTCLLLAPALTSAATFYVDADGTADLRTIQVAVDVAAAGDTVVLRPGVYRGPGNCDIDFRGKAIHVRSVDPQDPAVVETTVIDCAGTQEQPQRGFYVVDCNGVKISGLTIVNGLAPAGGAVYCKASVLELTACRILNNAALSAPAKTSSSGGAGGGLYSERSVCTVTDCLISGNTAGSGSGGDDRRAGAGGNGGGICSVDSSLILTGSTLSHNVAGTGGNSERGIAGAGGSGGAVWGDFVVATDCVISHNNAGAGGQGAECGPGGQGGGIWAEMLVADQCVVEANRAGAGGIAGPTAKSPGGDGGDGGGVHTDAIEMTNSLLVANRAGRGDAGGTPGVAVHGDGGAATCLAGVIRHCTIADNMVYWRDSDASRDGEVLTGLGAGILCTAGTTVTNSIVYGNTPDQMAGQDCNQVGYSDIGDGACPAGRGNLDEQPLFIGRGAWVDVNDSRLVVSPDEPSAVWTSGDYRLQAGSPCIDAGDPNHVPDANAMDLDGNPRLADRAVDMGAYEFRRIVPVYRFWSGVLSHHFYTTSEAERDMLAEKYRDVWTFEGIAYYAYTSPSEPNLLPVYRFWSDRLSGHFWTIDEQERAMLIKDYPHVWTYEGAVFYAYPAGGQPSGTTPVHRFWSGSLGAHFYTMNEAEKDQLLEKYADVWTYEGPAWYAREQPAPDDPCTPEASVYEFTGGPDGATYLVGLSAYIDGREAKLDGSELALAMESGRMRMAVDLDGMQTTLSEFHLAGRPVERAMLLTSTDPGQTPISLTLSLGGAFDALTSRGPYEIDPETLVFPVRRSSEPGAGDICALSGTAAFGATTVNIRWAAGAAYFDTVGRASLDDSLSPDRLDALMDGSFLWSLQQEDLLLETTVDGHVVQLYVASVRVQTTGLWQGTRLAGGR